MIDEQRAAFEAWFRQKYDSELYCQARLEAWQAALASPEVQALREALEEMMHRAHPAYMVGDFPRQKLIEAREQARAALGEAK